MKKVVIIGAGCLGRETLWLVRDLIRAGARIEPLGFVDDDPGKAGKNIMGLKVLGPIRWLERPRKNLEAVLAVGEIKVKRGLALKLKKRGLKFITLIHPTAVFSEDAVIGEGSIIFPGVVMSAQVRIGRFVLLNPGITLSHDVQIGDWSLIGSGAHFAGQARVGAGCEIGTGANVIPQKTIGDWCVVGAGACVISDLPARTVSVGVPARVIKTLS